MGAPSGGRAGLGGMSPGGGDYKGFFWVCCISYSPPKPLLILPSCTRFPARTPLPHLLGRGGFQLPHPQVILILRAKVIQEVIPVAVLPALCQLQRQACAVPVASRTTPERPPFIRAQRHTARRAAPERIPPQSDCVSLLETKQLRLRALDARALPLGLETVQEF